MGKIFILWLWFADVIKVQTLKVYGLWLLDVWGGTKSDNNTVIEIRYVTLRLLESMEILLIWSPKNLKI